MLRRPGATTRALRPDHWLLLAVLGIAGFFEGYDSVIFTVALPQIRDAFGLSQAQASLWLSLLFLGSIPAIFVTRYADVHGRRRLLLFSIVGYSLFTALTAASPTIHFFVYSQFVARLFLNAEVALAWTMAAEELPARARGFGFGWLATTSAMGSAAAALLNGALFHPVGISWRWLYFVALPPLAVVLMLRRRLPETTRYKAAREAGALATRWHDILRPPHRRWFVLIGVTDLLIALVTIADVFAIDFMQTDRGLSPRSSNLIFVAAGLVAIPFLIFAGSLSDRYGRKRVGCVFAALSVVGMVGFFLAAGSGPALFAFLAITMIGQFGSWPTLDAFYAELFPTGLRAFAGSSASFWRIPGESVSLIIGAVLIPLVGGVGRAVVILALGPLIGILIISRKFPETRGRELEEIVQTTSELAPTARRRLRTKTTPHGLANTGT